VPAVLLWSFGQGFCNLFLAAGTVIGLVAVNTGNTVVGRTLVLYTCGFMALSGLVLAAADALALGRPRNSAWGGVVAQRGPSVVVLAIVRS
jgi:putative membrane protein